MTDHFVIGWQVNRAQRKSLLKRFPTAYARPVADHVTLRSVAAPDAPLPAAVSAEIVGRADDGRGVEAMIVRLDGETRRPGGGVFHITWSLAEGRQARESNDVIAEQGWSPVDPPVPVKLKPARFP